MQFEILTNDPFASLINSCLPRDWNAFDLSMWGQLFAKNKLNKLHCLEAFLRMHEMLKVKLNVTTSMHLNYLCVCKKPWIIWDELVENQMKNIFQYERTFSKTWTRAWNVNFWVLTISILQFYTCFTFPSQTCWQFLFFYTFNFHFEGILFFTLLFFERERNLNFSLT